MQRPSDEKRVEIELMAEGDDRVEAGVLCILGDKSIASLLFTKAKADHSLPSRAEYYCSGYICLGIAVIFGAACRGCGHGGEEELVTD